MPQNPHEVLALIYGCIDDINETRLQDEVIDKRPDVVLVGREGCLDSLALATLLLNLERKISKTFGKEISLLDGAALDNNLERFSTPAALAELVSKAINQ